jgi:hypothetical protein
MELVVQLFKYILVEPNLQGKQYRQYELNQCLIRNTQNSVFTKIHLIVEKESDEEYYRSIINEFPEKEKCVYFVFGRQPKYSELVRYVATSIEDNKIVCIMNSDIFMGSTSIDFIRSEIDTHTMISLTRHEFTDEQHSICNVDTCHLIYKYHGSHDAFIFTTPVLSNYPYESVDIPQNVGGSEAIFMKSWVDSGKSLKNLCFDIPIFHMHRYRFTCYETIANHTLCNVRPTVPKDRPDIQSQMISMF